MKEKPKASRSTSRPIFASVMGYRRNLIDTCKSSSVLVVSTLVAFMYLLCFCHVFGINRLCNDELSHTVIHIMTHNHMENGRVHDLLEPGSPQAKLERG